MPSSGQPLSHFTILDLLGEGGMGQVFLAEDTILDRKVALKFLSEEAVRDPVARQRFVREAKSAASLDNPFICQVFETGEVDGEPFIAMEYVEGESLAERLRRGPLPVDEALKIACEVAEALEAAHERGIAHRDLKPANIMLSAKGHAKVMDFGLAKQVAAFGEVDPEGETATTDHLTATGAAIGTLAYMSPEQLRAEPLLPATDIFSFGIVLYEMLTGGHPFSRPSSAETIKAIMLDPAAELELDETGVSPVLTPLLEKALAKNPAERYQSGGEMVEDIRRLCATVGGAGARQHRTRWVQAALVAAGAVVISLGALFALWDRAPTDAATPDPVSLLIADIENRTGEEVFDGALEQALVIGLEEAPFISSYRRDRAARAAEQIKGEPAALDSETARLVALRDGINLVVVGFIDATEDGYRLGVEAVDSHTGQPIVSNEATAPGRDEVLPTVADLAIRTRRALGDTTPESVLLAAKETFTAGSLEASAAYSRGQYLMGVGRWEEALEEYRQAVQLDPELGRAYAGASVCYANLGRMEEAEAQFRLAMVRIDRMTAREKYRSRGAYYLATRKFAKAADEYTALAAEYPRDAAVLNNLPLAHFYGRDMELAVREGRRAVEIYPEHVMPRANLALFLMYAGEFPAAEGEAAKVLDANPEYELAFVARAMSGLGSGDPEAAIGTFEALSGVSPWGASLAASGLADVALYQGRLADAVGILGQGILDDRDAGNQGEAARKLATLARTLIDLGRADEAIAVADEAVASSRRECVLVPAAFAYVDLGQPERAVALADELSSRLGPEPQVYSRLIAAKVELSLGNPQQALALAGRAQEILDTWLGRYLLGRAFVEAGAFTEAHSELERCLQRRGEATALFLDDVPTYHVLPPVHYWLGRALEGLGSHGAADAYRAYLDIKTNGVGDPLAADARERMTSL